MNNIIKKKEKKVFEITNYIIKYLNDKKLSIGITKIQKLLYFCDAQYMVENNGNSMFDNDFQAWNLGPVVSEVYSKYKLCSPLLFKEMIINKNDYAQLNEKEINVIEKIMGKYGNLNAQELIDKTHVENGPWYKIYNADGNKVEGMFGIYCDAIIPKCDIYAFYKEIENSLL